MTVETRAESWPVIEHKTGYIDPNHEQCQITSTIPTHTIERVEEVQQQEIEELKKLLGVESLPDQTILDNEYIQFSTKIKKASQSQEHADEANHVKEEIFNRSLYRTYAATKQFLEQSMFDQSSFEDVFQDALIATHEAIMNYSPRVSTSAVMKRYITISINYAVKSSVKKSLEDQLPEVSLDEMTDEEKEEVMQIHSRIANICDPYGKEEDDIEYRDWANDFLYGEKNGSGTNLTYRETKLIELCFGIGERQHTQQQAAEIFGITTARVGQILRESCKRMSGEAVNKND